MKQCERCGKKVPDEIKSCPKCGSKEFSKAMKRRTKIEIIILAVIVVIFIGLAVFLSVYKSGDEKAETTTTSTTQTTQASSETTTVQEKTTAFKNAGTKTANVYSNEWVGIKINIPEGYTDVTADMPTDGDSIMAYDIAIKDQSGKKDISNFTLHFSNCDDEQEWLDYIEYHKDGTELMESLNLKEIDGVKATDRIEIAGEEYLSIKGEEKETGEIYFFAYRKIENTVVAIMLSGKTLEANEKFISEIEKI